MSGLSRLPLIIVACLGPLVWTASGQNQEHLSAFAGIELIQQRFGPAPVETIIEMRGNSGLTGQPQPRNWELAVYDANTASKRHDFFISSNQVIDRGPSTELYPNQVPAGFIDRTQVQVDSTAAFMILNTQSQQYGVRFSSVDYHLQAREFSQEAVWRLIARDERGFSTARIDISATTGQVLRTIWFFWNHEDEVGGPKILDSAAPRVNPAMAQQAQPEYGLRQQQPVTEVEPVRRERGLRSIFLGPSRDEMRVPQETPTQPSVAAQVPAGTLDRPASSCSGGSSS